MLAGWMRWNWRKILKWPISLVKARSGIVTASNRDRHLHVTPAKDIEWNFAKIPSLKAGSSWDKRSSQRDAGGGPVRAGQARKAAGDYGVGEGRGNAGARG